MIIRPRSALFLTFLPFFCLALLGSPRADTPPTLPALSAPQTSAAPAPTPAPQPAQPVYFEPTYLNLLRAMIRFKGYDIDNDDMLDTYAVIEGCDLYIKFYKDEFTWKQIRAMYRKSLTQRNGLLPDHFSFAIPLLLDRYDFQSGMLRFDRNSTMLNVRRLVLSEHPVTSECAGNGIALNRLPVIIGVTFPPFTIEGVKVSPDQAETLIGTMDKQSSQRIVYARYHLRINAAPQISNDPGKLGNYDFQGNLETISFFEDKDLQRPLWVYRPVYESQEQKTQELNNILNLKPSRREDGGERAPVTTPPTANPPND